MEVMTRADIKEYCMVMFKYKPTSYQLNFLYDAINHRRVVGVFSRQSGKSHSIAHLALIFARNITKAPILIFAPTERQAALIAEKIAQAVGKMLEVRAFKITRQTQLEFYFSNGGSIICQTVGDKGEGIRGFTAGGIILEEAGSIKDSIVSQVIMPMGATTNCPIVKVGTPRGKNHFYESTQNKNYKVHQYDYTFAVKEGIQSQEYVDEQSKLCDDLTWRTEMMAEFIEDSDAYFGYNLIDSCIFRGYDVYIPQPNETYYMGCDIARLGSDNTVLLIIKQGSPNEVVSIVEINKSTLDIVVDEIMRLDSIWNFNKIYIDQTGLGAGVVDFVSRKFNARPATQDRLNSMVHTYKYFEKIVGITFTIKSKLDMYSNLKNLMEQGLIKYPAHPKLISQLRDFRYEITENDNVKLHHSDNGFDDYCDALCLAAKPINSGSNVVISW